MSCTKDCNKKDRELQILHEAIDMLEVLVTNYFTPALFEQAAFDLIHEHAEFKMRQGYDEIKDE